MLLLNYINFFVNFQSQEYSLLHNKKITINTKYSPPQCVNFWDNVLAIDQESSAQKKVRINLIIFLKFQGWTPKGPGALA